MTTSSRQAFAHDPFVRAPEDTRTTDEAYELLRWLSRQAARASASDLKHVVGWELPRQRPEVNAGRAAADKAAFAAGRLTA